MSPTPPPHDQGAAAPVHPEQPMFDWENLRHYLAFARTQSLNGAARELGVEHATVARRIAALEQTLQFKLLDRRQRQYRLTPLGQRIADIGARIDQAAQAVCRLARAARHDSVRPLSISSPPLLASTFIAPHLGRLRHEQPSIDVSLLLPDGAAPEQGSPSPADIHLSLQRPQQHDIVARRLSSLGYSLYASPAYAQAYAWDAADYISYDPSMNGSPQQRWLQQVVEDRPVVLRARSPEVQAAAARSGLGVALLPDFYARQDSGLQRLECPMLPLHVDVWLAVHEEQRHDTGVRAVMDFLISCFTEPALG